tara:strand:- start:291 stop:641 length:351 start_codon:yes stop_codon:yes gene_type:complete
VDIKNYLRETFFLPLFSNGKPKRDEQGMQNVFAYKGEMASKERDLFFDEAYGEIVFDLFIAWVQSPTTDVKEREHLYRQVLAIGSIKEKLVNYETYGRNIPFLAAPTTHEEDEDES